MDEQKVIQTLKDIFDKYGMENLRNGKTREIIIKSYIPDMLVKTEYRDENMVLTQAMRSDAVGSLVTADVTEDTAKRIIDRLESEEHMRRDDAEFVVRCVVLAMGKSPGTPASDQVLQTKVAKSIHSISCEGGELSLYQDRLVFTALKSKSPGQLEIMYQNIDKVAVSYVPLRVFQGIMAFACLVGLLLLIAYPLFLVIYVLWIYCFIKMGSWCKKGIFVHTKTYCNGYGRSQKLFNFSCKDVAQKKPAISMIQKGMRGELHE